MSRSSRDVYYSSSSRSASGGQSGSLPPIHDVVGDVLQQPVRPYSSSYEGHRSTDRSYTPSPQAHTASARSYSSSYESHRSTDRSYTSSSQAHASSRGHQSSAALDLPPIHSTRPSDGSMPPRYATHSSSIPRNYYTSSSRPSSQPPSQQTYPPRYGTTSAHSYDVFVSSSNDGLVHKRSSNRDDFHHVPKEDAIASSTGRHICGECGRRFEKLSTLKNHLTTHSGEKPYECPDCGKCFSVSSNMRRHQLTHRTAGTSSSATRS